MDTLIIHPRDISTSFLKPIYNKLEDKVVVEGGLTKDEIFDAMFYHDRIMGMGHGSPNGLFGINFPCSLVIDSNNIEALKLKKDSVFIWCNADKFVNKYNLKGLYSGMFISEVGEAMYCGLGMIPLPVVDESNNYFSTVLGHVIDQPVLDAFHYVKGTYGYLAKYNPVAKYNWERIYLN